MEKQGVQGGGVLGVKIPQKTRFLPRTLSTKGGAIARYCSGGCKSVEKGPRGALFSLFPRVGGVIESFFCAK